MPQGTMGAIRPHEHGGPETLCYDAVTIAVDVRGCTEEV